MLPQPNHPVLLPSISRLTSPQLPTQATEDGPLFMDGAVTWGQTPKYRWSFSLYHTRIMMINSRWSKKVTPVPFSKPKPFFAVKLDPPKHRIDTIRVS